MAPGNHTLPSDLLQDCSDGFMYCMAQWASDVTTGMFWFIALLAFSITLFLATIRFGTVKAFGFGSFAGMIGGIWLAVLTLIPWWVGSVFIIIGVIGLISMVASE